MKKFVAFSLAALMLVAATGQQASAWCSFQFGIGLNVGWQSGDNHFCCGLWDNGPAPAQYGYGGHGHHHGYNPPPMYVPIVVPPPHYGYAPTPPAYNTMAPMQYSNAPAFYYYQPGN